MKKFIKLTPIYTAGDVVIIDADSIIRIEKELDGNGVVIETLIAQASGIHSYVREDIDTVIRLISTADPTCTFVFNKEGVR